MTISLICSGVERGVDELAAIEFDNLRRDPFWEDELEKAVHFDTTFDNLLALSYKKKDSKSSLKTISSTDSTTSLKRSSHVAPDEHPNKKAKLTPTSSSSLSVRSPSQATIEGDSPASQDSTTSTDEDLTRLLLLNFVTDCLRFLRSPFTMPAWSQIKVKLGVGYKPAIMFILTIHSPHDTRFRLGVEVIRARDDRGLHLVTMTEDKALWHPSGYEKILPIISLEVCPRHLCQYNA